MLPLRMDAFRAELEKIIERLDPGARARLRAQVDAVLNAGATTLDGLFALLADHSAAPSMRSTAAFLIGRFDDPRAATAFMAVLDDRASELRHQAVIELGSMGADEAVEKLLRMLDADDQTREVVAWALGEISDERAQAPLLAVLADRSQPADLRGQAAESLGTIDHAANAVPALIAALGDAEAAVRFFAAFALGGIGDPRALEALDRVAATDHALVPGFSSVADEARNAAAHIRARR
jgi:HEAT repeat protein